MGIHASTGRNKEPAMVSLLLLLSILLSISLHCNGEEINSKLAGPKYAIIKETIQGDFKESLFEKKLGSNYFGNPAWGYQSLIADNRDFDGYCGYCKDEEYKGALFCQEDSRCGRSGTSGLYGDSYFLEYNGIENGEATFSGIATYAAGTGASCCSPVGITPVPGKVKLMSSNPLLANYIGFYTITRQLYNGFQQYERANGGPRIYVNIYNQWVIGIQDHTDQIIMSQVEATPYFESAQPVWNMSIEHVNEEDTIVTLRTEAELLKSSGQPPECIIEGNYFNHEDSLFKLSPDGSYKNQGDDNYHNQRYYNRSSYGWWARYRDTDWIEDEREGKLYFNPEQLRTSESSTVIPRLGWGGKDMYVPDNDISIIGSPCTITLVSNNSMDYAGTYNIEEDLVNDHPAYARNSEFSIYVNPSMKWVFGQIKKNQGDQETEREDKLILSQDLTMTPLTWPEWSNSGTQQTPVLTIKTRAQFW